MAEKTPPALIGLLRGLQVAFNASEFFDLTVSLKDGGILHAHRVVVCTYSQELKALCSDIFMVSSEDVMNDLVAFDYSPTKDPMTSMIRMEDEDPQLIREMFYFFYHGFYSVPIGTAAQHDTAISHKHIGMYSLATKYGVEALQQYAIEAMRSHLAKCTTLGFLSVIGPAYHTGQMSPLRKVVVSEAGVRCRDIMARGSRARHIFFATMSTISAFQTDMFVQYFEAGAGAMCRNCRGWVGQYTICNQCTPAELAKTKESDDEEDFSDQIHDEHAEDSSQTLIADLSG